MSNSIGPEDRQPPDAAGGSQQGDATVEFVPKDMTAAARAAQVESHAEPASYAFFDPPRAPGELGWLSHYRVRRLLGEGGMGLVFHAEDTDLLRPVALKVIKPELAGNPQAAQRFLREARAMAALKHDHIVTIYQVGQERGVSFLAMEYLRGISLFHWLERGHKPAPDLVLRIGREIALGLAAAHKQRLIHRDIKPANIWLEVPAGRVKILDFGLARIESGDMQITNPGIAVGTPAYMAPELARGEDVSGSSDLFSLGCVLYELCTGRLPFQGATVMAVLTSLSVDTPIPPRDLKSSVPPTLDALVMRLLAKQPADRPASAQAVVDAIKSIERELLAERQRIALTVTTPLPPVAGEPKLAPSGGLGMSGARRHQARNRAARRALWIAAPALGIASVATAVFVFRPRPGTTAAARPSPTTVAPVGSRGTVAELAPFPSSADSAAPPSVVGTPARAEKKLAQAQGEDRLDRVEQPGAQARQTPHPPTLGPIGKRQEKPQSQAASAAMEPAGARHQQILGKQPAPPSVEMVKRIDKPRDWGDLIDPDRDCRVVVEMERNRATIFVPGKPHILSAEIGSVNAPRILRDIKGDFDVMVRVTGTSHPGAKATTTRYSAYHGAGILIWQDQQNYVRLEIATEERRGKAPRPYVNFEYRKDGALAVSSGLKNDDDSSYLRLKRRGSEIEASFGPDGARWTSFPPLFAKLNDRLKVGVSAINTATKALAAQFDGFEVSEKSSSDEAATPGRNRAP
jgi:serine/threonine protein kinase/regulation of enolase protein 1 (concanavalin A-like superfamily)